MRQRLNRLEHMKQLTEELAVTPIDWEEDEEAKEWAAVLELQERKRLEEEVKAVCFPTGTNVEVMILSFLFEPFLRRKRSGRRS